MANGEIVKSMGIQAGDLQKINNYARRDLKEEEVYLFNVLLCDNEVDRDYECFTAPALHKLSQLFQGKTGIFDHDPKGEKQTARIFDTEVRYDNKKQTEYGAPYAYLQARAYMVRSVQNADLILEIDAGIKKEVSVGCSVAKRTCSICGTNLREGVCEHRSGMQYNHARCYTVLEEPTDAYEWSFVAIPAQKNAGVVKAFRQREKGGAVLNGRDYEAIKAALVLEGETLVLSASESAILRKRLMQLERDADLGRVYIESLRERVVKLAFLCGNEVQGDVVASVAKKMSVDELKAFERAYEKQLSFSGKTGPDAFSGAQLAGHKKEKNMQRNENFKI